MLNFGKIRSTAGDRINLFKELVEKLVSQNEPESAATVVRDYL
jgi:hypothetical protein